MNHHTPLNGDYARTLMELRGRPPALPQRQRRSTRESMALRLHRLADRLDGS